MLILVTISGKYLKQLDTMFIKYFFIDCYNVTFFKYVNKILP